MHTLDRGSTNPGFVACACNIFDAMAWVIDTPVRLLLLLLIPNLGDGHGNAQEGDLSCEG